MIDVGRIDALIADARSAEAHAIAAAAASQDPSNLDAQFCLAKCEAALGRHATALGILDRMVPLGADAFAPFHLLHAQMRVALGDAPGAIAALERATAIDAQSADAWFHLAHQHSAAGNAAAALEAWERYAAAAASADAWVHAGRLRAQDGEVARAAQNFRAALSLDAAHAGALRALGALAAETFDFNTARDCLSGLLARAPDDEGALSLLGFVLGELGEDAAALEVNRHPTPSPPSASRRARAALALPQITESGAHIQALRERYAQGLDALEADAAWAANEADLFSLAHSNFLLAYHGENDLPLQRRYAQLVRSRIEQCAPQWLVPTRRRPGPRIRVGFLSSFFRQCTIGNYFERWVSDLDPARFERVVFSTGWAPDELGRRLQAAADRFDVLRGGALEVARAVRDAGLDVLIYPEVGMGAMNCLLAQLRLAPLQCVAWGHPVTTGSREIDVFFGCAAMEPLDASSHYAERLVCLPGIGTRYARPLAVAGISRDALRLPAGAHAYACPQSLFKIHPDNDDLFLDIAERDSNAVLLFFQAGYPAISAAFSRRIAMRAEQRGIDARGRFRFVPRQNEAGFRAVLAQSDVVLDTLHWSGGNTSLDALAVAAPIVTLPGRFMRGRQTLAMLHQAGVADLVANDRADYVDKAIAIAADTSLREDFRARLQAGRQHVFDQDLPVRALADQLEALARG
ncbi:MAG: hypothetical protein JNK75_11550 [Betaproteobacteria bacterium]|nr:hypothetical protein [Betaproteobacteria bacterium]